MLSSIHRTLDRILLLKISKTVTYLHEKVSPDCDSKNRHGYKGINNLKTFKSRDIPFGYKEYSIKDDSIRLSNVIHEKEKEIGDKEFSAVDMYRSILKTFRVEYTSFVLLALFMLSFEAFVKYRGILYFKLLIGESSDKKSLKAILPGLLMFILEAILLISETHIKYYIQRVRARVMGAINGVSLLRLSESDLRIETEGNNGNDSKNDVDASNIPKSNISRYQNVISVDSDFSESAISYSVRIFIFPLKLFTSFAVAAVTFDEKALKFLLIILSVLFTLAVTSLFVSTLFKRPFIAQREKRIAESTNIIENSRSLILTQDHIISSYHDLLTGTRRDEMYYGSFRKYFFTLEEIISRSMGFVCYGIITVYVWYNHFDVLNSIEMIVNSAWLVPSFYSPLQEVCYLIYYVSEGTNALSRLAKLVHITKTKRKRFPSNYNEHNLNHYSYLHRENITKNSVVIHKDDLISIDVNEAYGKRILPRNITLSYGTPVIMSSNDISYSQHLTDLLRTVIFGVNGENGVTISLFNNLRNKNEKSSFLFSPVDLDENYNRKINVFSDIFNPVCYVPAEAWITDGMSLFDIILNGRDFDLNHWNRVIDVCDLGKDFSSWGINDHESAKSTIFSQMQFSRGQKIRLALSRAIYGIGPNNQSNCDNEPPPIVLLDSIFSNLDPPICYNIFSKLFNNVDGVLMNTFSIVIMNTHMLTFLPKNVQESSIYIIPHGSNSGDDSKSMKDLTNNHNNNIQSHKHSRGSNTSASVNSIINDYCFESDLSRDLWEMSTDEEAFSVGTDGNHYKNDDIYICNNSCGEGFNSTSSNENGNCATRYNRIKYMKKNKHCFETRPTNFGSNMNSSGNNMGKCGCCMSNIKEENQDLAISIEEKLGENVELLPKNRNICIEDNYSTCFYYILKAANKYRYPNNWSGFSKVKESSKGIIIYLAFLVLPQLLLVFGEKFLLSKLASDSAVSNTYNSSMLLFGTDFWYFTYFVCVLFAIAIVITNGYLEVSIGLRAANNLHNTFLLGYISSKLSSCIRSLPVSFVLNRLSLDQLTVDYCTTKRVGQFTTAVNRLMGAVYLSLLASEYPFLYLALFLFFIYMLYRLVLRYFITSCRLLHNAYISEVSPLVNIVRNICDGKESLQPQKLDDFYIQNGYEQLQEVMRPILIQSSLETWLKLRLQVGILIPATFLNMISSYFSGRNSKILIALITATTYSSLPRIDEVVRYWMRLERELVSVERLRKYIQLIKSDYFVKESNNNINIDHTNNHRNVNNRCIPTSVLSVPTITCETHYCYLKNNIVLDSVYGFHYAITSENSNSQLDRSEVSGTVIKRMCCLRNISAVANKGDIIGIVGRSGSGKTSLLHLIAKSLDHLGNVEHRFSNSEYSDTVKNHHILNCKQCKNNIDDQVLSMFLRESNKVKYIAMLPIEVYFNDKTTIKRSIDPLNRYSNDNIISSLNICGVATFLIEKLLDLKYKKDGQIPDDNAPLMNSDMNKLLNICLEKTIGELSLPMQVQRMLLFTHFFLKRSEINILLIDEPPVIYGNQEQSQCIQSFHNIHNKKPSSLIPSIIFKYFSHSITFIVAHDIRNLNGIKEFWYLHQGSLTIKKL